MTIVYSIQRLPQVSSDLTIILPISGKNVDEVQDELKSLLFGEDEANLQNSTRIEDELFMVDEEEVELSDRSLETEEGNPIAAELRQRPFKTGPKRRRPFRNRIASPSQGRPIVVRPNPIIDFRDPQIHKIPGRIQNIPERLATKNPVPDMFGSLSQDTRSKFNSVSSGSLDCDFYTDSLCLGVKQYPM